MAEDRISTLPDGVLELILSFLPLHEAVQTSVLARSWRHLWMRSPSISIVSWGYADEFYEFVSRLLRHRRLGAPGSRRHATGNRGAVWAPLDYCYFDLLSSWKDPDGEEEAVDAALVDRWIRYALRCNVRQLVIDFGYDESTGARLELEPHRWSLASEYLTKLYLCSVAVDGDLDFSGCPALLVLEIWNSRLDTLEIFSSSLQHLNITHSDFFLEDRTRIRTPSLVSLCLICEGAAPLLQRIPSLESAAVELDYESFDHCCISRGIHGCSEDNCDGCRSYYGTRNDRTTCVLLSGLSEAASLKLSADPEVYVFSRDIKWCPTFNNLKTLVLTDWFVADDFSGLIWFLRHSPILEKLTLKLSLWNKNSVRTEERCKPREQSVVSAQLKTIQIECSEVNAMVVEILKILAASGIKQEQINIKSSTTGSGCFSNVWV